MGVPRVDLLVEMKELLVGYDALTKGMFEQEIATLQQVTAESKLLLEQITEGQGLATVKAQAQAEVDAMKSDAVKLRNTASKLMAQVTAEQEGLNSAKAILEHNQAVFTEEQIAGVAGIAAGQKNLAAQQEEFSVASQEVVDRQGRLTSWENDLAARETALHEKLVTLKALSQ